MNIILFILLEINKIELKQSNLSCLNICVISKLFLIIQNIILIYLKESYFFSIMMVIIMINLIHLMIFIYYSVPKLEEIIDLFFIFCFLIKFLFIYLQISILILIFLRKLFLYKFTILFTIIFFHLSFFSCMKCVLK
jgi:hypothetical protein